MKTILYLVILSLLLGLGACEQKKLYTVYWQDQNLCIVLQHPTLGVAGIGIEDWLGVELSDVAEDIYKEIKSSNKSDNIIVWVRFEDPITDKYGNETMNYNDFIIAEIPVYEAKKYKSGEYLNREYKLIDGFRKAAFGQIYDSTSSQTKNQNELIEATVDLNTIIDSDTIEIIPMGGLGAIVR